MTDNLTSFYSREVTDRHMDTFSIGFLVATQQGYNSLALMVDGLVTHSTVFSR